METIIRLLGAWCFVVAPLAALYLSRVMARNHAGDDGDGALHTLTTDGDE